MKDILDDVAVALTCDRCGKEYEVAAAVILDSHELLEAGYPAVGPLDGAPLELAALADADALRALRRAWRRLAVDVGRHRGHDLVVRAHDEVLDAPFDERALARWVDDGGRCAA